MRRNTNDKTIERALIQKWRFLMKEYELIKEKKHHRFKFVSDFYNAHGTSRQVFQKYYHRFKQLRSDISLLPRKRGPKWKSRRPLSYIENKVVEERQKGINRYEIHEILKPKLKKHTPSPSGIYNICRRHNCNKLNNKMKETKRQIIKDNPGELGHVDCHYLSKDLIVNDSKRYYLVCVLDSCTRIAWAEVVEDIKSLSVMFATLKSLNLINKEYQIQFEEVLTDNGSEFKGKEAKQHHPFERMLMELGVKHRYTKPYRPQTNGKAERFWRTIEEDLLEETIFDSLDHLKDELMQYLICYNEQRPHQGIGGMTPKQFRDKVRKNLSSN